jgi:hypothetical protein
MVGIKKPYSFYLKKGYARAHIWIKNTLFQEFWPKKSDVLLVVLELLIYELFHPKIDEFP